MAKNAREAALTVLEGQRKARGFSDQLLKDVLEVSGLPLRDRALASRLCYGVIQNSILLDHYIDGFTGGKKLQPKLRDILRLSLYQILFMDRIPAHAAVNSGVELCKTSGMARAAGLANAVLRGAASGKSLPALPENGKPEYLSVKYSVPLKLAELFTEEMGYNSAEEYLAACNEIPPTAVITNSLRVSCEELSGLLREEGLRPKEHDYLPGCLLLEGTGDLAALSGFEKGFFYVQDPAAYMAVMAAAPQPGQRVLDACAAPGGKSFAAALMMQNKGEIISCDIQEKKLSRIKKGAERLGFDIIRTHAMDARDPRKDMREAFDIVIADVPCSGLGVIRKKPDIRFKEPEDFSGLPEIQGRILEGLAPCVKPGGVLLYSTCTVLDRENMGIITSFLKEHREFTPEGFEIPAPGGIAAGGMISLYPQTHGTDGFFICKLRKANEG